MKATSESHYTRNRDRLQAYQRDYIYIKRNGRRKVGKEVRTEIEGIRRRELAGNKLRLYSNEIVRRDNAQDPEETPKMNARAYECHYREMTYFRTETQQDHPATWQDHYLPLIRIRLQEILAIARSRVTMNAKPAKIHYYRRIVAFYHQELELNSQGKEAWDAASEDKALVVHGRGINKTKFKRLYGF